MGKTIKQPTEIGEEALEQASGGVLIGLLLPAVQKVREGAAHVNTGEAGITDGTSNAQFGDGSVRFLKGGTN